MAALTKAVKSEKKNTEESGGRAVGCFPQLRLIQEGGGERIQPWDLQPGAATAAHVWVK